MSETSLVRQDACGLIAAAMSKVHLSEVDIEIDDSADRDEHLAIITTLIALRNPWYIGGALCKTERKYGEIYAQAIDASKKLDIPPETIYQYMRVYDRVPVRSRLRSLGWSMHQEVAALDERQQDRWLGLAEKHSMTRRQLRHSIKAGKVLTDEEIEALSGKNSGIKGIFLENVMADFRKWKLTEVGETWDSVDQWPRERLVAFVSDLEDIEEGVLRARLALEARTVDV